MNISNNTKEQIINLAINEYLSTPEMERSLTKLGEKYGIKRQTLSKHLKARGIQVINYQNIARLNENAFDSMDNEEQFYWLGFMYADGCISKTGNRIEVHLSLSDISHLEKFRKFLNHTTTIRTGTDKRGIQFCHLAVRNKHMWNTLNNLGCVPCKTLILEFPNISIFKNNFNFVTAFIRGYVDGDGCLTIYPISNSNSYRTVLKLKGQLNFLEKVNSIFKNKGHIRKCGDDNVYDLQFSDVMSRVVARVLYSKATIYLDRKYNKYLEFCRLEEESSRRLSSKIGESWDADSEVISKIAQGLETPQSVAVE